MNVIEESKGTPSAQERELVRALPFPSRSSEADHESLQVERENLAKTLKEELKSRGYDGLVTQSAPHVLECYVEVVCWTPDRFSGQGSLRRSVKIVMDCHPHLRFKRSFTVTQSSGGFERTVKNIRELETGTLTNLILFVIGEVPRLGRLRFSRFSLRGSSIIDRIMLPLNRPENLERIFIATWRQHWLPIAGVSLFLTIFAAILIVPVIVLGFTIWLRFRYPDVYDVAPVYPTKDPRVLLRYDSWHVVVPEIGQQAAGLRESIVSDLHNGKHDEADITIEQVWNKGLDGMIFRDQVVLSFRRCLVFIEIHAYGDDLYLDWEAYLNLGYWAEGHAYAGFPVGRDTPVRVHEITSSAKAIDEYDFSDGNFSVEWVHATVMRHLKRLLAEHKIDQEIDFRVIREDRGAMLKEGKSQAKAARPKLEILKRL